MVRASPRASRAIESNPRGPDSPPRGEGASSWRMRTGGRAQAMSACSGIRADGGRCQAHSMRNSEWCINHDPDQAEVRRPRAWKGAMRGGLGRARHETEAIKVLLEDLTEWVLVGELEMGRAA